MSRLAYIAAAALTASASPAAAQDAFSDAFWQFTVGTGFDFSSGNYGAAKPTEILYVPLTLKLAKGPWTFKADVPWIRVSGPAVLLDGSSVDLSLGTRTGGAVAGLGDIQLYGTYSLESLYNYGLFVDLTGRVKVPTASFAKGLGTGVQDVAFQVDVAKTLGSFMPFVRLGYRMTGIPQGYSLRDVIYGSVGVQYSWSERFAVGAFYDVRQSALSTAESPQELTAYINKKIGKNWSLNVYGTAGLSNNSPSAGGGLFVTYKGFDLFGLN